MRSHASDDPRISSFQSWSTTLSSERFSFSPPLSLDEPKIAELVPEEFTRDRVVPTI
jgi:hypothetical protein